MTFINTGYRLTVTPNEKAISLHRWVVRIISGAIGFILLAAAVMKATDMEVFIRQISAYGLITQPLPVALGAWGMIVFQFTLGAALLLFYRPRISLSIAALLWLFLTCLTAYAWATGTTDDCGCYGSWLKSTPKQATIENLAFLAATLVARWLSAGLFVSRAGKRTWSVAFAPLVGLVLPLFFGFPISPTIEPNSQSARLNAGEIKGLGGIDLGRGSYLVVLMGTDCSHCQEFLPDIDMLAEEEDIPKVVGLSKNNEAQRQEFVKKYEPLFPIGQVSERDFWRLLGSGKMPRILLVQEGKVQKVWDGTIPGREMIRSAVLSKARKDSTS